MTKLIVTFRNFVNAPKRGYYRNTAEGHGLVELGSRQAQAPGSCAQDNDLTACTQRRGHRDCIRCC
jgi:hypothetical protein